MSITPYRLWLEQTVLGACLLENGYQKIADILQPVNFSTYNYDKGFTHDHQQIFKGMQALYPKSPIDMLTVSCQLRGIVDAHYIVSLCNRLSSAANIRYHAILLLEISIRETFLTLLTSLQQNRTDMVNLALYEIQDEALDIDNDIFNVIEKSIIYMQRLDEPVTNALVDFHLKIDKRIAQIKNVSAVETLIQHLSQLNQIPNDPPTQMAVSHLTDIIKTILANGTVKKENINHILTLSA